MCLHSGISRKLPNAILHRPLRATGEGHAGAGGGPFACARGGAHTLGRGARTIVVPRHEQEGASKASRILFFCLFSFVLYIYCSWEIPTNSFRLELGRDRSTACRRRGTGQGAMDVRPLVGAHPTASAHRLGRPPAVPAIPVARAALLADDALHYGDTPGEPGSEEAGRPEGVRLPHQPSEQPPGLNFGAVFKHHAPPPPPPPLRLPEGGANPGRSAPRQHPQSFPRRRPASHRISRSPGTPSLGPTEQSRQRPATARQEGRGQRPGTGRADHRASYGSAALPQERPATARTDTRARRPSTARADGRPSSARTDSRATANAHEHAADSPRPPAERPQTARTLSAVSEQERS